VGREYRPNARESAVISRLDHAKESQRYNAMNQLRQNLEEMADRISMKLIEERLIETISKADLEEQIRFALQKILDSEEFEIQYQTANLRTLVPRPNFISLFVTAYIVEKLIDHKCIVDIFGTDDEIYRSVNRQVGRFVSLD
jgi:N-methylhydantoinase B/oxoprolinase/acetone carboxylase alpha subunit